MVATSGGQPCGRVITRHADTIRSRFAAAGPPPAALELLAERAWSHP
jgi:hypothetical protein